MRRYTTPTLSLAVEGADLSGCKAWVSLRQRLGQSTLSHTVDVPCVAVWDDGEDASVIEVALDQEQTGGFRVGEVMVQVNWMSASGTRDATDIAVVRMEENVISEVITYG